MGTVRLEYQGCVRAVPIVSSVGDAEGSCMLPSDGVDVHGRHLFLFT